jgi:hypothetical protein
MGCGCYSGRENLTPAEMRALRSILGIAASRWLSNHDTSAPGFPKTLARPGPMTATFERAATPGAALTKRDRLWLSGTA